MSLNISRHLPPKCILICNDLFCPFGDEKMQSRKESREFPQPQLTNSNPGGRQDERGCNYVGRGYQHDGR